MVVWNTGGDAYRPAVYGDFITVVKKIHQTSASWGIYGARGNLVRYDTTLWTCDYNTYSVRQLACNQCY